MQVAGKDYLKFLEVPKSADVMTSCSIIKEGCTTVRDGTSRENLCRVGYRVRKMKSGPGLGRVYPMQIDKTLQYFTASLMKYEDW